jgi:hypothetical protein
MWEPPMYSLHIINVLTLLIKMYIRSQMNGIGKLYGFGISVVDCLIKSVLRRKILWFDGKVRT